MSDITYEQRQFLAEKILEHLPSQYVRTGRRINLRCPFCGDSHKSATKKRGWLYLDHDCSYYCFNCGISMSGLKFLEAVSGSDYQDIKTDFMKMFLRAGTSANSLSSFVQDFDDEKEFDMFNVKSILPDKYKKDLSDDAKAYLKNRKVLDAPFLKEHFYSAYNSKKQEYILIPWTLNGVEGAYFQLNDFKKNGSLKYIFPKNTKKLLYGLDEVDMSFPYIICFEGVYDSLFVKNGIATGTKSLNEYQRKIIKERYPKHKIVVSFDNDVPGISQMIKMIKRNDDVMFFRWFNQNTQQKDINDYILSKNNVNAFADKDVVKRMIVGPLQMKMFLIENSMWNIKEKRTFLKAAKSKKTTDESEVLSNLRRKIF